MASYVDPSIREKFESLSINLKNAILEKDVQLHTCLLYTSRCV